MARVLQLIYAQRRGPNVMKGYWRDPEATDKILTPDGWLKTGDIGVLDEEGFLYIKDRSTSSICAACGWIN